MLGLKLISLVKHAGLVKYRARWKKKIYIGHINELGLSFNHVSMITLGSLLSRSQIYA